MTRLTGSDKRVANWLEKIGIDPKKAKRVVIDIPCDDAITVYIEQWGDSSMFEVEPPPALTTAIHLVPPQADFEEAIKIVKNLNASERPIVLSGSKPTEWKEARKNWEAIRDYSGQTLVLSDQDSDVPIKKLTSEQEPTPEWLAEFEARQQAAIKKWEQPGD